MEHEEAGGKVALHASQSGEARTGKVARVMALEQLSALSSRRSRTCTREPGLGRDLVSGSRVLVGKNRNHSRSAVPVPRPSQRARRTGHPTALVMPTKSRAWATRQLSLLRKWRAGQSEDQSVACGGDEDSGRGIDIASTGTEPRMPTLCKRRKGWDTQTVEDGKGRPPAVSVQLLFLLSEPQ